MFLDYYHMNSNIAAIHNIYFVTLKRVIKSLRLCKLGLMCRRVQFFYLHVIKMILISMLVLINAKKFLYETHTISHQTMEHTHLNTNKRNPEHFVL